MKKPLSTLGVLLMFASLTACKKNQIEEGLLSADLKKTTTINTNTGVNTCFDWQSTTSIGFTNGSTETLPWYSGAVTQIPNFILEDYKREDGWELLYNMLSQSTNGQNYVIFYNKFTGIIRTYYYLKADVTPGSNGMWALGFSNTNALLNNVGYFAEPVNAIYQDPLAISSNLSVEQLTKGIAIGWNAFDTELTYDPNSSSKVVKMRLLSSTSNIAQVALTGELSLNSSGTIVSIGSKNGLQDLANATAKSAGEAAKTHITDMAKKDSPNNAVIKVGAAVAGTLLSGGVTAIVNAGINLLFGSFIGKKSEPTTTTQKIEYKTNGTLSLTGTISSTSANNVSSIANLYTPGTTVDANNFLLPCYNKKLGVWNLLNAPVVATNHNAIYSYEGASSDVGVYTYSYFIDPSSINLVMNPDVLSEIESYEVKTDLIYYSKFKGNTNWNSNTEPPSPTNANTSPHALTPLYDDGANVLYSGSHIFHLAYGPAAPPPDPTGDSDLPTIPINKFDKRYVVKVTVTLKPKAGYNQDPIVITRSYLPTYQLLN